MIAFAFTLLPKPIALHRFLYQFAVHLCTFSPLFFLFHRLLTEKWQKQKIWGGLWDAEKRSRRFKGEHSTTG
jgi:hypothetical protein